MAESWALKRVLYATDFSDNAAPALDAAVTLARAANAKILAVHIAPAPVGSIGRRPGWPTPYGKGPKSPADLIHSLEEVVRPALAAGVETDRVLRQGDPAEEIVGEAQRAAADLIVVGRHRGGRDRWFLGSVAEGVVRRAPCPVIVVKPISCRRGQGPHRVMCAVDLSETSATTLAHAAALASVLNADLLLLHVLAGPGDGPPAPSGCGASESAHDTVQDAGVRLAALVASASVPSGRVQQRVAAGMPREEILRAALEGGIDLVVVGSHGGGILDRQFVGSTTRHLIRKSECDVLVVPAHVCPPGERCEICSTELEETPLRSLGRASLPLGHAGYFGADHASAS
jgi:nucleotide-binding universal stress UspA family protein